MTYGVAYLVSLLVDVEAHSRVPQDRAMISHQDTALALPAGWCLGSLPFAGFDCQPQKHYQCMYTP